MFKWMREHLSKDEGFTLVELMVVVLIIAILIAIAIPTFLGARERAQDRAAQSSLRNALTAEKVFYTDEENFATSATDLDADGVSDLEEIEPSLTWQAAASADPIEIYVRVDAANDQVVCMEALSEAGTTFVIGEIATGVNAGTYYGSATLAACSEAAVAALATEW
jgi:type IV pilus assembly protein PilA